MPRSFKILYIFLKLVFTFINEDLQQTREEFENNYKKLSYSSILQKRQ